MCICTYIYAYQYIHSLYITLLPVSRETILITTIFIQLESTNKWPAQLFILQSKVKVKVIVVIIIKRWLQQSSTVYIITYTCILVVITCNHLLTIIYHIAILDSCWLNFISISTTICMQLQCIVDLWCLPELHKCVAM